MTDVVLIDADTGQEFDDFSEIVDNVTDSDTDALVAVDCEGISLSRLGTLEIVSICFEGRDDVTYLIDFQGAENTKRVKEVKKLLESKHIEKVIHDSRMDGDALYHHHGIKMRRVHDTSCFHEIITGRCNVGLNDVLEYNDLRSNFVRDKSVYTMNPSFWATRPLTRKMKDWASGDVAELIKVARNQSAVASRDIAEAQRCSEKNANLAVEKHVKVLKCSIPVGRFIGPRGANIHSLEKRSGTLIYQKGIHGSNTFMVYYNNEAGLTKVKLAMCHGSSNFV